MKVLNIFFCKNVERHKNLFDRNILCVLLFCDVKVSWCYYRPPTKLGESNVIKGVSQSQEGWVSLVPLPFQGVGWVSLVPGSFQGWVGMSGQVGMSGGGYIQGVGTP